MAAAKSRTEASMHERLQQLAGLSDTSPRKTALLAASRFKSTWVELGEALVEVQRGNAYGAWGYQSFETYCKNELHLRADTVLKLTRSFSYLQQHAPHRVRPGAGTAPAPALDMVHLLSQAAARTQVPEAALKTIGEELLAQDAPVSRADAMKKLRESDPDAFRVKQKAAPRKGGEMQDAELRKALLLAERLYSLLGEQGDVVSADAQIKLEDVVQQLRRAYGRKQPQSAQSGDANLSQNSQMH